MGWDGDVTRLFSMEEGITIGRRLYMDWAGLDLDWLGLGLGLGLGSECGFALDF